ncbi:MAG: RHS repeat protein [Treponema sp.]|nr:RHS repeat protein [Treponema sp.]
MKNRIAKIAVTVNIAGLALLLAIAFIGKVIGFEGKLAEYLIISFAILVVALPPLVLAIVYMLGSKDAGDCMVLSLFAAIVFNIIIAIPNNINGWDLFKLPFFYALFYSPFVIIRNRKKITAKMVRWALICVSVIALVFLANKVENIIRDSSVYKYDEQGNLLGSKYDSYDSSVKVHKKKFKDGTSKKYDDKGNIVSETDLDGKTTKYEYDEKGNLIKETDCDGKVKMYEYYENGSLKKTWSDEFSREYEYFKDQPEKIRHIKNNVFSGEYAFLGKWEEKFDRKGNLVYKKTDWSYTRYFYFCTHWKNGNVKTKRVFKVHF